MRHHRLAVLRLPPPSPLQLDVDEVLKPRLQLLLDLGLTVVRRAVAAGWFGGWPEMGSAQQIHCARAWQFICWLWCLRPLPCVRCCCFYLLRRHGLCRPPCRCPLQERAMKGVLRMPEVLRISPEVLEAKVAYYTGGMQTPLPVN